VSDTDLTIRATITGDAAVRLGEIDKAAGAIAQSTAEATAATRRYEDEIAKADREMAKLAETSKRHHVATAEGLRDATGAVVAFAAAAATATVVGAIDNERHEAAVRALGPAYDAVTRATNGTVTATDAWHTQQVLLQSGLHVTGEQLAAITRAGREYARATGTETTAAIEQLSQALVNGEAGGLRRFGLSVQQNATRTETFERAMRSLTTAQESNTIAERSLAEETDHLGAGIRESASALAAFVSQALDVPGAMAAVGRSIREATRDFLEFQRFQADRPGTTNRLEGRSEALSGHAEALQRTRANLQARNVSGVDLSAAADISGLTTEQIQTVRTRLDVAARTLNAQGYSPAETAAIVAGATRDLRALPAQVNAMREANAQANAPAVIDIQGDRPTAAAGGGAHAPSETAVQIAGANRARELALQAAREFDTANKARIATEIELARAIEERGRAEKNAAVALDTVIDTERHARAEIVQLAADRQSADNALRISQGRESEVNRERVTQLADLRAALSAMLAETDARIAQAQDEHRAQSEINDLMRERIGITRSLAQTSTELAAIQRENSRGTREFADAMGGAGLSAASALTDALWAAADAHQSFGAAVQAALREQLKALAKEAVPNVLKNLALAAAAAFTNPAAVPGHLAAAGLWTAVGAAAGIGAAAIPAPAAARAPAGAPAAASVRGAGTGDTGAQSGPLTLNINVSGALMNEGVQEGVIRALNDAHARGVMPRFVGRA